MAKLLSILQILPLRVYRPGTPPCSPYSLPQSSALRSAERGIDMGLFREASTEHASTKMKQCVLLFGHSSVIIILERFAALLLCRIVALSHCRPPTWSESSERLCMMMMELIWQGVRGNRNRLSAESHVSTIVRVIAIRQLSIRQALPPSSPKSQLEPSTCYWLIRNK